LAVLLLSRRIIDTKISKIMNNVIFADAHEHAIKTVPEMILVYNKQVVFM